MKIKSVEGSEGVRWLSEAWRSFKHNPGGWIVLVILYFVIMIGLSFISIIGSLRYALDGDRRVPKA